MDKDLGFPVFSRGGAIKDIELPPLSKFDHPEPRTMQWSDLELYAIKSYASAAVEADRAQRVPDVEDLKDRLVAISSAVADSDDREAQAIIQTTLELLASTPAPAQQERKSEQAAFEEWLYRVCPSGDVTEVQRQWEASSDLADWLAAQHQEPPQQERKPMTYREIADATSEWAHVRSDYTIGIIRAAERHHGIKE